MLTTTLLETLLEIERSIGHTDNHTLRSMLMEAESQLLRIEQDVIGVLTEMRHLRELKERCAPPAPAAPPAVREWAATIPALRAFAR